MKKLSLYTVFLFLVLAFSSKAQQANTFHLAWNSKETLPTLNVHQKPLFTAGSSTITSFVFTPQTIKYTLPKGAVFCRMEDALYKHFNVWIKVRMGTDDKLSD